MGGPKQNYFFFKKKENAAPALISAWKGSLSSQSARRALMGATRATPETAEKLHCFSTPKNTGRSFLARRQLKNPTCKNNTNTSEYIQLGVPPKSALFNIGQLDGQRQSRIAKR